MGTSYLDLEIYQLSVGLAVEIDKILKTFSKHEFWETDSQIRRPAKSIPANIGLRLW